MTKDIDEGYCGQVAKDFPQEGGMRRKKNTQRVRIQPNADLDTRTGREASECVLCVWSSPLPVLAGAVMPLTHLESPQRCQE